MGGWNEEQLFSSKNNDWGTPWSLFEAIDAEFHFALDAAASSENAKCAHYVTEKDDGLSQSWLDLGKGGAVWLNPPYGRGIGDWIEKAYRESVKGCVVVCLTFCRTDTKWWHDWAMKAAEIRLIPGRVTFGGSKAGAPAPSCLLVFDETKRLPRFTVQELPRK